MLYEPDIPVGTGTLICLQPDTRAHGYPNLAYVNVGGCGRGGGSGVTGLYQFHLKNLASYEKASLAAVAIGRYFWIHALV